MIVLLTLVSLSSFRSAGSHMKSMRRLPMFSLHEPTSYERSVSEYKCGIRCLAGVTSPFGLFGMSLLQIYNELSCNTSAVSSKIDELSDGMRATCFVD